MKCDNPNIPEYLKSGQKKEYQNWHFFCYHKLYRLKLEGNPITIPEQWGNAISCRWSNLIKKKDILIQTNPEINLGNDFDYVFVKSLRKYFRESILDTEHEYKGKHVIKIKLKHSPLPCEYCHCEILIKHTVYNLENGGEIFDEVYSYESWENKTALLKKQKSKFFKELRSDFRLDMIKLISIQSHNNTFSRNISIFFSKS